MHSLTLQTGEATVVDGDILGRLGFAASSEVDGMLDVTAKLEAVAEKTFDADENATEFVFSLAADGTVASKMTLSSAGLLTVVDDIVIKSGGTIGGSADPDLLTLGDGALTVAGTIAGTLADGVVATTQSSSDNSTKVATTAYVDAASGSGDITGVTLAGDSSTAQDLTANVNLTLAGGNGITTAGDGSATISIALDAALTTVTSLLATDIKIGEDNQTKIDFETADEIHFYAANVEQVYVADNIFGPQSDSDVDLGTTGVRWKDAYIDTITTTGDVDVLGNIELGHASDTTIARASSGQITVEGTAVILAGAVTGITSLLATDIKIGEDDQTKIDFETADEIHFYAANVEQVYLANNIFGPQSDSDVDLGTTGVRWKDAYIDTITTTGDVDVLGNIELGHASDTTIARASAGQITVEGTAVILAGAVTGITSLLATDIKIGEDDQTKIDFETANEIHFYANNTEQVYLADNIFGPQSDSDVDLGTTGVRWKDAYIDTITTTGTITAGGTISGTIATVTQNSITTMTGLVTVGTIGTGVWQGTAIASAYIADNAITLAKLAGGTDGQIITFDASGDPVAVGPGTDGQVLTSTGAGSPPAFEDASGGGSVSGNTFATDLKIGRDSQNLVDFATTDDKIIFRVANVDEVELVANVLSPVTSDGMALGTGSLMWSDLFLASAGVINFNNGDVTLTHSSNTVTLGGGKLSVQYNSGELAEFKRITGAGNAYVTIDASAVNTDEEAQLRLKSGVAGKCRIYFGDTGDNDIGQICYEHADNSLGIKTNNTTAISIDSSANVSLPNGTLTTQGIIREVATKVDTNYTITADDHIILVDTTNTNRTITLPSAAAANIGQEYTVKKIDSGTGLVNIVPASTGGYGPDDIDEYDTAYILYLQHDTVTFVCGPGDATAGDEQWWIIAEKVQPHSAQLEQRTAQSVPARTTANTVVTMTDVRYEQGCDADTSTNRIDIKRKGKYAVTAHCLLDDQHALWGMKTRILHHDDSAGTSSYHGETKAMSYIDDARDIGSTTTALLELDVDDYVQAIIWNSYVDVRNTRVSGVEDYSYISVQEIK
tara:strand:- start:1617 stop:4820 length:3204 start_codon:yes stop_codon:yes gene_type:complete